MTALSDGELVRECRKRPVNEEAWREFWRRFYPIVRRKVYFMLRSDHKQDAEDADDMVQLAFVRIFTKLDNYDPARAPVTAFVRLITISTVLEHLRKGRTWHVVPLEEAHGILDRMSNGLMDFEVLWSQVVDALKEVKDPKKLAILEGFLDGKDTKTLCDEFGITANALYKITYEFRRHVRNVLKLTP